MQDNTRKITYGAMMIALFAIIIAVSLYVPLVGLVTVLFIPLPIILYRLQHDRASSFLIMTTGIGVSLLVGGKLLLPIALIAGLMGFVIGDTIQTGKTKLYTYMTSGLTLLITTLGMYVVAVLLFKFNVLDILLKGIREMQEAMRLMMETYGRLPAKYDETAEVMLMNYEHSLPSTFIIGVFLLAFVILTMNLSIVQRLGIKIPQFPPFRGMKLPIFIVIIYGLILLIMLLVKIEPGTDLYLIYINATVILRFLFLLQGISLIHYFIYEMKLSRIVTIMSTIFGILLGPVTMLLGILDAGMNIRAWIGKDKAK
ncbi:YybS family protein [Sporosarcina limicola]|uniref:Uncharacterized protein YybS (DUF2232 family) n=1 Tax=Sporosarcina limicola TaxID=34101 RepID=A0A927MKQ8_9BACL|nr:DUF2232 domain-containing protein [Sporosarcina limicola]MBE1556505.1 uncharacterized protein YybS (DUF2232 family) [Sporosarcina limicola]